MRKLKLSTLLVMLVMCAGMQGQGVPHANYVLRASTTQAFSSRYALWQPGSPLYSDAAAEDEEFFISRVRPKQRFSNTATQVNTALDGKRKMFWWCPIGENGWNATPTFYYNSDVFSMWSYVDHYGNWTAGPIRQLGAFTDVCHKNGVVNSVVCQPAFGATVSPTSDENGKMMQALITGGADKYLKFLRYYGIDGLGFNSEFNFDTQTFTDNLNTFFQNVSKKKDAAGVPNHSMAWYSLTANNGKLGSTWDALDSGNKNWFNNGGNVVSNSFFLNYNWNASYLSTSQTTANSFAGRSSYDVYAGMDLQGRSAANWLDLQNYNISIGIWGAHNANMPFESRGELGSEPSVQQQTYQKRLETLFTGSSHNPVNTPAVSNKLGCSANLEGFHGISKFISARSTLQTNDLGKEPFVTYFNMGNGKFFNFQGVTTFPNEWYNIGMQDYLPTWRWWLSSSFMGRTAASVPSTGVTPAFTWEDAWFGGSCLKVTGQTTAEYLHLFKTKFPLQNGDKITVRYKIQSGSGDVRLSCSAEGTESTEVISRVMRSTETPSEAWVEKVIVIGASAGQLNLGGKTLAMMALKFESTSADFSVLFGEMSIKRTAAVTPSTPAIISSKLLSANYKGVDFKLFFKMKDRNPASPETPIYNDDVNAWYFKIYSQQKNEEPVLCTTTTSWASYVVGAPVNNSGEQSVRFGVSAVSLDGDSESPIAWTDYSSVGDLAVVEGIEIDKPVIKANETFTVRYKDPNHKAALKWDILNAQTGVSVKSVNNTTSLTTSLPNVGIYDLAVTTSSETITLRGMIQVSGPEVGALPRIDELKANNGTATINTTAPATVNYSYVGRAADGWVSRGLRLPEKPFAIQASQLGLTDKSPFSICFWFKPERFMHGSAGTQLLNIRTLDDAWPASDWGYVWSDITPSNSYSLSFRKTSNAGTEMKVPNYLFQPGAWYHIAFVVDYQSGRLLYLYVNGKKVAESGLITDLYTFKSSNWVMVGGPAFNRAGLNGFIDEFQFYNKALSAADVLKSMEHQSTLPAGLTGYWDFEANPDASNKLYSTGSNTGIYAAIQDFSKTSTPLPMAFGAGAPFIQGSNYQIVTTPEWTLKGAQVSSPSTGNGETGNVGVQYLNNGVYRAALTLKNSWGSDTKTFEFVKVGASHTVTYSVTPGTIHPNNVKVYYANVGSTTFEPLVSGGSYPDGVTLKLVAKPVTLDGASSFQKWTVNGVDNMNPTVEMMLDGDKAISVNYIPYTGLFTPTKPDFNFKAYPNPFVNEVYVQFVKEGKFTVNVTNLEGQVVSVHEIQTQKDEFVKINIDGAPGMYLVNISENKMLLKSIKVLKK